MRLRLASEHESSEIAHIRARQRRYLTGPTRANLKFHDFIDAWERLHDWQVKTGQGLTIVRTNDGHYAMTFLATTLMLQPHQTGNYISWGYDSR